MRISQSDLPSGCVWEHPVAQKACLHREMQARVLAETIVDQLVSSDYSFGEVVSFTTEVLRVLNQRIGMPPRDARGDGQGPAHEPETIPCRVDEGRCGQDLRVTGARLYLRPVSVVDSETLLRWKEEPAIQATFSNRTLRDVTGRLESGLDSDARRDLMVCLKSDDAPVGMVCLHDIDLVVKQADMTNLIGVPEARGHGYAHEASQLLLAYAFGTLDLERIYLRTAGFNMRNIRLNERLGFQYEGVQRRAICLAGE